MLSVSQRNLNVKILCYNLSEKFFPLNKWYEKFRKIVLFIFLVMFRCQTRIFTKNVIGIFLPKFAKEKLFLKSSMDNSSHNHQPILSLLRYTTSHLLVFLFFCQYSVSAFTSANTNGTSYFIPRAPSLIPLRGAGPNWNKPNNENNETC